MQKRMFIPIDRNYNEIWKDFQIQKIKSISRTNLIIELVNAESWIYELIKEDTINLFLNTGGYTDKKFTTDDLYKLGVNITAKQISKKCFFFSIKNYELILKKLKSRIVNNIRNFFSSSRKINYLQIEQYYYQIEDNTKSSEKIIDELDLQKIDKKTIKIGLAKVWQDALTDTTFDIVDFEELCKKFQFKPDEVLGYNPYTIPPMAKEICNNGNYQLILIFEFEEVI